MRQCLFADCPDELRVRRLAARSLHVRRWGTAGRPVIFLHSLGPASSAAFFGLGAEPLVEAGYAIAAPDLPGFGGSAPLATPMRMTWNRWPR
jgi:pimeloyl-ACP methyl ester carboxylesterase